jgi:beta-galactosidase
MAEAHFTVIRVGESVWSTWEPENGRFDLDWLQAGAGRRPRARHLRHPRHPDLRRTAVAGPAVPGDRRRAAHRAAHRLGRPAGGRLHPPRVPLPRRAGHPEGRRPVRRPPGGHRLPGRQRARAELLHNHGVFQRFVDHLRAKYGDVETLNREWGLVYWSHRLSTWADLWTPDGNVQPQYDVAWREFQARQSPSSSAGRPTSSASTPAPEQFVTTCISYDRPAVEDDELTDRLDVAAGNPYYDMQDGLRCPTRPRTPTSRSWKTTGVWALYQTADWMYSSRQEPFLVTETNANSIGMAWDNRPAYDGQWRQAAWALVARGARMIEYWHWHTLHFGAETYWGGVLPHSGRPGRTYAELARLGAEFEPPDRPGRRPRTGRRHHDGLLDAQQVAHAEVPAARDHPDGEPDPAAYHRIFDPFYRGAFDAGLQVRIVHARHCTTRAANGRADGPGGGRPPPPRPGRPGLYLADDTTLDWLAAYAHAGGHLVLGPRTGYADHEARARHEPDARPPHRRRGRLVRRVQQPGAGRPRARRARQPARSCRRPRRRRAGPTA